MELYQEDRRSEVPSHPRIEVIHGQLFESTQSVSGLEGKGRKTLKSERTEITRGKVEGGERE